MAGFLVRRKHDAQELQAHDAELAKRAASALLAADEGVRAASEELDFAEAELGAESTDAAAAVIAAVRRHLIDAFRLNRLNHDAMPGTPGEVRARYELILRLCEWAEHVLGALTSTLADRVARARRAGVVVVEIRADVARERAGILTARDPVDLLAILPPVDAGADASAKTRADAQAHLNRPRAARSALDAATTAAGDRHARATRTRSPANLLQHAVQDADRTLGVARDMVTTHPGCIGDEALTRLAEAERTRIDLGHCLGTSVASTLTASDQRNGDRVLAMARRVAALASESLDLARRDLAALRTAQARARSRPRDVSWA
ncbi:hypothetical protein [Agromyces allii]|uniref:DUF222 domain-containing protein n=1 Tax=Agromyces allii TaxID=393607 RepID=A0ABP5BBP8_9MICO|nr:hypothetical protein [Agromyces allii]